MKMTTFCDVTPCSLVKVSFEGMAVNIKQITRRPISGYSNLSSYHCKKGKNQVKLSLCLTN
jgi:hypothetical protein